LCCGESPILRTHIQPHSEQNIISEDPAELSKVFNLTFQCVLGKSVSLTAKVTTGMNFLKKNPAILLGACITVVFILLGIVRVELLDSMELRLYDLRMKLKKNPGSVDQVVIVDIDGDSVEKLGRWPWPRSLVAKGIEKINAAEPKIIGLNLIFSESEQGSVLKELENLTDLLAETLSDDGQKAKVIGAMQQARQRLDNDSKVSKAIQTSGRIVLPVYFNESTLGIKPKDDPVLATYALANVKNPNGLSCPSADMIVQPLPEFLKASNGTGHVNLSYDTDGKVRREIMVYRYGNYYFPSFSLILASRFLNASNDDIQVLIGTSISIGQNEIPLTGNSELLVDFKKDLRAFRRYSFFDVINDKIPPEVFRDRIVLVTPSAPGIQNPISTPGVQVMSVGEFTANAIWSILNQRFIRQPSWDFMAWLGVTLLIGAVICFVLPRLKALFAGITFVLLFSVLLFAGMFVFMSNGLWVQITYPLLQLLIGYIGVVSLSYFVTETRKEKVEGESAETNRMLGLSFQSQGMLDMAFDKFRKVPVEGEMKDTLYNLGLDYERKRQFNKAAAVYEHIEKHDSKFKDVSERKNKLLHASDTMVYGDGFLGGGGNASEDFLSTETGTRPTLGRYEIIKQLGKGAMGIVYLGQDPRINRTTAIKTFRFSDDFEPEEAEKMKQKFFREAESAGTLSHPNIVTIYDAGDEHDLAYIAMEYLEGADLSKFTKKKHLLPMRRVIDYIADIAEGLDYAHEKGIVHRDIKPANVMVLKNGIIKITDFGIARITASSQTQTGIVKGTPHYMSPEQISGEKVDGRSDLFSLGVMMFQLLTGGLPFHGDSPAALMHQIMNVRHPDPRKLNPKLLKAHVTIIDKAMEKNLSKRYQRGMDMANHLRTLGRKIDAHIAARRKSA
jgi:CHASE2 domain-containing sensor protein/predicted Ser/Thr protein kinase